MNDVSEFDDGETLEPNVAQQQARPVPTLRVVYDGAPMSAAPRPRVVLRRGATDIGRTVDGASAIRIEDPRISRRHCEVVVDGSGAHLVNLSKYGTFVNGAVVEEAPLQDRDVIRVGDSLLVFRIAPAHADVSNAPARFLGVSAEAARVRSEIALAAANATAVLVVGETGTGKEVVAASLHVASGRTGPLVAVNASAIPETLAESQLFGHRAGAFTGAKGDHRGYFLEAQKGTLLLDEIGDLPLVIQPKLLRALEERRVMAVGATRAVDVDTLVVAATHKPLRPARGDAAFRADLYARLAEFIITIPTLRERREDILLLAESQLHDGDPRIGPALAERMLIYAWPYNVRELFKVMGEARARGAGHKFLELALVEARLPLTVDAGAPDDVDAARAQRDAVGPVLNDVEGQGGAARDDVDDVERPILDGAALHDALVRHQGVIADVAREVGRSRKQVYRWITAHGFDIEKYRGV